MIKVKENEFRADYLKKTNLLKIKGYKFLFCDVQKIFFRAEYKSL